MRLSDIIKVKALVGGGGVTPEGNQDITTLDEYNVADKATARVSAAERAKIIPENIKKDITILGVTGTHEGGGTKPSYLISDGDSVSTFYFNTEYDPASVLAQMTYVNDPYTGYDVCEIGIGYFYAVKLSASDYALVWNDGTNIVPIYSTTPVPSFGVTTAGWQVAFYAPSTAVTVTLTNVESHFAAILDNIVAVGAIAFGTKKETLSVTDNGTYNAPSGTLYNSVSVSVSGGGSQPQLNAPTISISGATLSITNPSTNGNFVKGYKIFVNGVQRYTTTSTSYDLSGVSENTAAITVKAYGDDFQDSPSSNSVTYYHQYSVSFYDGETEMTGSPVTIGYGSTVAQAVTKGGINTTKSGYTFDAWYSDSSLTTEVSDDTQITGNTVLYGKWNENAYITDETPFMVSVSPESGVYNKPAISPNSNMVAATYGYKSGNYYRAGVRVFKYANDTYTAIGSTQYIYTEASTTTAARAVPLWISNTRLAVLGYGTINTGLKIYDIGESTVTDVTSTYIPSVSGTTKYLASMLSINSSGKLTVSQTNNSSKYIFDTTQTPFTYQSVTWTGANDMWIMDDNNLVAYVNYDLVMKPASDYSATPTTLITGLPGREPTAWHKTGDYLTYFGTGSSTGYYGRGCYRIHYTNGAATTESLVLGNNISQDSGAVHNIDGYWIVVSTDSSVSSVRVYDTTGALVSTVSLSSAVKQSVISNVSADGTKMFAFTSNNANIIPFKISPQTGA